MHNNKKKNNNTAHKKTMKHEELRALHRALLARYRAGMSMSAMAEERGVHVTSVYRGLRRVSMDWIADKASFDANKRAQQRAAPKSSRSEPAPRASRSPRASQPESHQATRTVRPRAVPGASPRPKKKVRGRDERAKQSVPPEEKARAPSASPYAFIDEAAMASCPRLQMRSGRCVGQNGT